jgi:hypothetical protein
LTCELARDAQTDTAGGTCNEGDFTFDGHGTGFLIWWF